MPKQSKVRSTRIVSTIKPEEDEREYRCCTCGKKYTRQTNNFPMSQSPIYKGNHGHITTCRHCVDKLFDQYKQAIGDEKEALRRICMKFDIYWNEEIYGMLSKANTSSSRVLTYISRTNLLKYQGKTFDDTLDEEYNAQLPFYIPTSDATDRAAERASSDIQIDESVRSFWGAGFNDAWYEELSSRYDYWTSKFPNDFDLDVGTQALLRQICILETQINKDLMAGKPVEKLVNALNTLLGSANLKPAQNKKEEALDASMENMPLGVGIKKWEDTRPLPDMAPEFKDVDGIIKYISTWFYGHLGKMVGVKNFYSKLYDKEIARLRVEKPEYEEDDDEALFDDVFGGDSSE